MCGQIQVYLIGLYTICKVDDCPIHVWFSTVSCAGSKFRAAHVEMGVLC